MKKYGFLCLIAFIAIIYAEAPGTGPAVALEFNSTLDDTDATVSGTVLLDLDHSPAVGAIISAEGDGFFFTTATSATGAFSMDVVSGVAYRLYCTLGDYAPIPSSRDFRPAPGESVTGMDFFMAEPVDPDAGVSGHVQFGDGTPVGGINVKAVAGSWDFSGTTGSDGNYTIEVVGGDEYVIRIVDASYIVEPSEYRTSVDVGGSVSDLDFVLTELSTPNAVIRGNVTVPAGADPRAVNIIAEGSTLFSTYPSITGDFIFQVYGGESYTLTASYSPYIATPPSYDVTVAEHDTAGPYSFSFSLPPELDASISGTVTFASGDPVVEIPVEAVAGGGSYTGTTSREGYYHIPVESGDVYTVTVSFSGYFSDPSEHSVDVSSAGDYAGRDFELTEAPDTNGTLTGTVTLGGLGIPDVLIIASGAEERTGYTTVGGNYSISLPPGDYSVYIGSGYYSSVPDTQDVTILPETTEDGADFALEFTGSTDASISGTVTIDGAAAVGMTVLAKTDDFTMIDITDGSGNYSMAVPGGFSYKIYCIFDVGTIEPLEYREDVETGESLSDIDFAISTVSPPTVLSGTVFNADSTPAADIQVEAVAAGGSLSFTATSNSAGIYSMEVSGDMVYDIHLLPEILESEPASYFGYFAETGHTYSDIDFYLIAVVDPNVTINGRVVMDIGGGVEGVNVVATGPTFGSDVTDGSGNYSVSMYLDTSSVDIFVSCEAGTDYIVTPSFYAFILSPDTVLDDIDFELRAISSADAEIQGRVTNAGGSGVSGARIRAFTSEIPTPFETLSDGTGNYSLPVFGGYDYNVSVEFEMSHSIPMNIDVYVGASATVRDVDFSIYSIAFIEGVVMSAGHGLRDVNIYAERTTGELFNAMTDSLGHYLMMVIEGTFEITVSGEWFSDPSSYTGRVLTGGDTLSGIDFDVLSIVDTDGTITGRVTDEVGSGFQGVVISAFSSVLDHTYTAVTDSSGGYSCDVLSSYSYVVTPRFSMSAFDPATRTVAVPSGGSSSGNNFTENGTLELDASISGSVEYADGSPAVGINVSAIADGFMLSEVTDSSGNYAIDIPGGFSYTLILETSGLLCEPSSYMDVFAGAGASLTGYDYTLYSPEDGDVVIRGNVSFESGRDADSVQVRLFGTDVSYSQFVYTDDSGNYSVRAFGDHTYLLETNYAYHTVDPLQYELSPSFGETLTGRDFVFHPEGGSGTVLYSISTGWNMLSHPGLIDISTADHFEFAISLYQYNPSTRAYYSSDVLNSGKAFWLLADEARSAEYSFEPIATEASISLGAGWNFIGMCQGSTTPSGVLANPAVISLYAYNPSSGAYFVPTTLEMGYGYWILATEPTEITLP